MAQALPKFNSIRDDLVSLSNERNPSEFSLRRISNQIDSLIKVDALHGYILYGMLSAVTNDITAMNEYHQKALKIAPNDELALMNYAISLSKTSFPIKALEIAKEALVNNKDDIDVIRELYRLSFDAGQFSFCLEMLETIKKLKPDEANLPIYDNVSSLLQYINSKNISEDSISGIIDAASTVLRASGLKPSYRSSAYIESDDESSWIYYGFNIDTNLDRLVDANMKLIDKIIDEDLNPEILDNLIIKFNVA